MNIVASHAIGKNMVDKIFGAGAAAKQAVEKYGLAAVVNGAQGILLDESEKLICLPTVERTLRSLPVDDLIGYAPIKGLPDFLESIIPATMGDYQPEAYCAAIATSGGTGGLHHSIWNYTELGDTVLTTDWFWTPYRALCEEALRRLDLFELLNERDEFNLSGFAAKADALLQKQDHLLIILNTPAHNPTGYSLSPNDWDELLDCCRTYAANPAKKITLLVDAAYLDFAGGETSKAFFAKFSGLPANLFVIASISMSKSFTMYGQRVGAMIGISSDKTVIDEFIAANTYTSRATWSNINRGAMKAVATICRDSSLLAEVRRDRAALLELVEQRARIFTAEAQQVGLKMLPYLSGFFMSVPAQDPDAVCAKLQQKNIFLAPLEKGVRLAVCSVPTHKMTGVATAVKEALSDTQA